ncbi:MAG: hypothetical protein K9N62_07245 [Verrucomicrobia bacterium]|jgi:hypothetical protein|nr:hypothetical protein [Verrucomicrobiota bacterium]
MSLKAFHLIFISASLLLSLGFGIWAFTMYFTAGGEVNLIMALGSLVTAASLMAYEKRFLRTVQRVH